MTMYHGNDQSNLQSMGGFQEHLGLAHTDAPLYGGAYDDDIVKPPKMAVRRPRLNLVGLFACLFVPWLLFCFTCAMTSFHWYYDTIESTVSGLFFVAWSGNIVVGFIGLAVVILLGIQAADVATNHSDDVASHEPTWWIFLFITAFIAWGFGLYTGINNFYYRMQHYYGMRNLGAYHNVDPATISGQQIMDAGRVLFKEGSRLDLTKSMSFRNDDLYCVAPIVGANHSLKGSPQSYDFWAIGVNCCCGDTVKDAKFQCGEYNNPQASGGLRLMKDELRPFFRLAVQQAVNAYGIRSTHPLFFHWVADPVTSAQSFNWEGHRSFLLNVYEHFVFQLACLGAAIWFHTRRENKLLV